MNWRARLMHGILETLISKSSIKGRERTRRRCSTRCAWFLFAFSFFFFFFFFGIVGVDSISGVISSLCSWYGLEKVVERTLTVYRS